MRPALALIATIVTFALATPAFAEKPVDAGQGRGKGHGRSDSPGQGQPGPGSAPGSVAVSVTIAPADQLVIR